MSRDFMRVEAERLTLGVAMKAILHDEDDDMQQRRNVVVYRCNHVVVACHHQLLAYRQMSMYPYDPYLNAPQWVKADQRLWKKWLDEKGIDYR